MTNAYALMHSLKSKDNENGNFFINFRVLAIYSIEKRFLSNNMRLVRSNLSNKVGWIPITYKLARYQYTLHIL